MYSYLGIDIGAVSATAALLVEDAGGAFAFDRGRFRDMHLVAGRGQRVFIGEYLRTRGRPLAAGIGLLQEVIDAVGLERIKGICFTGSGSALLATKLRAPVVNEFRAIAVGLAAAGVECRTVFEMGGETSKYLRLSHNEDGSFGIIDYATNGDCAAGTGSFLDQQAARLRYPIERVGQIVLSAERTAQIAGRCSVFAKSDMIHAQQKGYNPAEVLRGLCEAVARNFRTAVARSHPIEPPVAFIGGVTANQAVVKAMKEAFDLEDSQFLVPAAFAHIPAIGAAAVAAKAGQPVELSAVASIRPAGDGDGSVFPTTVPLSLDNVVLLRDRVEPYRPPFGQGKIDSYLGIDVGSVSTNVVVIDEEGAVIKDIYTATQGRPIEVVSEALREIEADWGERLNIRGVGTTGSGRELIGQLTGADTINDEITAHKTGATFVGKRLLDGQTPDTIFEIGGQDSKYISVQDGIVVDFTMNDACAAGTGSFLEERAEELGISIKDEFAEMALRSISPIRLGERCTVFMERDVNSYLQRRARKEDLVAGLAYSVVYNYINRVVRGRTIGERIFFQGGTAYNDAVAAAFAAVCGKEIVVPPHNGVIGAIAQRLLARDKMNSSLPASASAVHPESSGDASLGTYVSEMPASPPAARKSGFRGYDLSRINYSLREFTCRGCSNACQIQEFEVEGEKTYWGDKCSERYRKRAKATQKPIIQDLLALQNRLLMDDSHLPVLGQDAPSVGIPMAMFAWDSLPLWRTFLAHCGFRTILSELTNKRIIQAGLASAVAEPCFPIIAAHGHVADVAEKNPDYIFLPNIISLETSWMHTESHLCPWHQTLPFVIRRRSGVGEVLQQVSLPFGSIPRRPREALQGSQAILQDIGHTRVGRLQGAGAALAVQDEYRRRILAAGREAIEIIRRTGSIGIVLVGRPYNMYDVGMNLSIASKLRDYYGVNCIPLDFLDVDGVDIRDINENMYWQLGRRVIAAAKMVGHHPNLHIIYITNFKCGPDSFVKHYIRSASGKPFLSLQFDGHSNDAGIMTRCEAYLDSKGILRPWRKEQLTRQTV